MVIFSLISSNHCFCIEFVVGLTWKLVNLFVLFRVPLNLESASVCGSSFVVVDSTFVFTKACQGVGSATVGGWSYPSITFVMVVCNSGILICTSHIDYNH